MRLFFVFRHFPTGREVSFSFSLVFVSCFFSVYRFSVVLPGRQFSTVIRSALSLIRPNVLLIHLVIQILPEFLHPNQSDQQYQTIRQRSSRQQHSQQHTESNQPLSLYQSSQARHLSFVLNTHFLSITTATTIKTANKKTPAYTLELNRF